MKLKYLTFDIMSELSFLSKLFIFDKANYLIILNICQLSAIKIIYFSNKNETSSSCDKFKSEVIREHILLIDFG